MGRKILRVGLRVKKVNSLNVSKLALHICYKVYGAIVRRMKEKKVG